MLQKKTSLRRFIKNEQAISEEFTALPALSIVMIGFTLFVLLIANTYSSYEARVDSLDKYQTADFIAIKLTNPDCYFIREGGLIDLPKLQEEKATGGTTLETIRDQYRTAGVEFIVRISWLDIYEDFPVDIPTDTGDRIAVSKDIGIYLNEAQTTPGKLTIIIWSI